MFSSNCNTVIQINAKIIWLLGFLYAVEGKVHFGKDKTLAITYQLFIGVQGVSFLHKILPAFHWMHEFVQLLPEHSPITTRTLTHLLNTQPQSSKI